MNPSGAPQNISSPEQLVAALGSLPPMAQVLARLQSLLADPNSDLGDIAALIRLDAAMTTRVIRISNSAWFSRGEPCRTIDESVNRVGFREVFQVVAIAASGSLVAQPLTAYGWGAIRAWRESAACALAGELIAEGLGDDPAASFMNGLLHAIGRQAVNRYAVAAGKSLADQGFPLDFSGAEFALLGFTQASAGACMLKKWNFSRENSEPVRNQYEPLAAAEPFDRLGAILYGARLLGTTACSGVMPPDSPDEGEIFASLHTSRDAVLSHLANLQVR